VLYYNEQEQLDMTQHLSCPVTR